MKGRRVSPGTPYDQLASEPKLLLDPASDHPQMHLVFDSDGVVRPHTEHGSATIATLELNRGELVHARRTVAQRVSRLLQTDPALGAFLLEQDEACGTPCRAKCAKAKNGRAAVRTHYQRS